jgi:hypothetical protein
MLHGNKKWHESSAVRRFSRRDYTFALACILLRAVLK